MKTDLIVAGKMKNKSIIFFSAALLMPYSFLFSEIVASYSLFSSPLFEKGDLKFHVNVYLCLPWGKNHM